ncbi:helix-turn-helix domain-containing protein [Lentzea rhizosphaerae]|uniref:Helix-turn-helix domain-containing protein n=1 Tax=Lentzea rhizosphaerae TaxID=2041025 RepID=A0ABV8C8H1_9PSEU
MPKRSSTTRGREFGEGMRAVIKNSGLNAREVADLVSWDEAKVSDVVTGKGGVSRLEVALLLGVCRAKADERDHLLELFPERDLSGWWQPHGRCAPVRPRTALTNLAAAETLISWHTHAVPVLLRTAEYEHAVLTASATVPVDELDERLGVLQEMQKLLTNGLDCTFYIHELALDLQIGEPEEHIGQLQHLILTANREKIRILVLPAAAGAHAGMAGPFTQLKFPKYQSLVWTETENSSLFVETKEAVGGYADVIRALDEISLDEDESRDLIIRRCVRLQEAGGSDGVEQRDSGEPFPPS